MNPAWNARSKDFNDNAFRFKFHFAPLVFIHLHGNVAVGHPEIFSTCVRGRAGGTGAQYINFLHPLNESRGFATWFLQIATPKVIKKCAGAFSSSRETFFFRNLKNDRMSFLGRCNVETVSRPASRASPAQKSQGLRVVCSKNFSRPTFFFVFSAT